METTRRGGFERIFVGGGGVAVAVLGALGAAVSGWLPWPVLPAAWLGGNAAFVLLLNARSAARPAAESVDSTHTAVSR